jgi:hypothetical protein
MVNNNLNKVIWLLALQFLLVSCKRRSISLRREYNFDKTNFTAPCSSLAKENSAEPANKALWYRKKFNL